MKRALDMFVVEGIYTSIPLQKKIMHDGDFASGALDTTYIARKLPEFLKS